MDSARRNWLRGRFNHATDVVRPPWLLDLDNFTDTCTRCSNCISACPEHIIKAGDGGFPEIQFNHGECTFCERCADACPEHLFGEKRSEPPWDNKAVIGEKCLAMNQVSCQSCQDACEPRAIRFTPTLGRVAQPQINNDDCNSCGACVSVCPTNAITIQQPVMNTLEKE